MASEKTRLADAKDAPDVLRLQQEHRTAQVFDQLKKSFFPRAPVSLFTFDFHGGEFGSVAWKTSLAPTWFMGTVKCVLAAWEKGAPRYIDQVDAEELALPTPEQLERAGKWLKSQLPESRGYALIVGVLEAYQYHSTGDRQDVAGLFEDWIAHVMPRL